MTKTKHSFCMDRSFRFTFLFYCLTTSAKRKHALTITFSPADIRSPSYILFLHPENPKRPRSSTPIINPQNSVITPDSTLAPTFSVALPIARFPLLILPLQHSHSLDRWTVWCTYTYFCFFSGSYYEPDLQDTPLLSTT